MYDNISTNLELIEEKLNSSLQDDYTELKNIFVITDHLLKLESNHPLFDKYIRLKENFLIKSKNISENIDTQYHLYDHANAIHMLKYNKMLEINDKVDEVNELNDFMNCVVKHQGNQIDSILEQISIEEERTENILSEMRKTYNKYQRRGKVIKCIILVILMILIAYIIKIVITALINKII